MKVKNSMGCSQNEMMEELIISLPPLPERMGIESVLMQAKSNSTCRRMRIDGDDQDFGWFGF